MRIRFYFLASTIFVLLSCSNAQTKPVSKKSLTHSIAKIEMNLSAFGVESDNFPSIDVFIDFSNDSSICVKSFYDPEQRGSTYSLTKSEIDTIVKLLGSADLEKLKNEYKVDVPDQASSITKIYTTEKTFVFDDYGLQGDYPLQEIYKIVYRY